MDFQNDSIVWLVYWIRSLLSIAVVWPIQTPLFLAFRVLKRNHAEYKGMHANARYVFNSESATDMALKWTLQKTATLGSLISGVISSREVIGELAIANKEKLFLGLEDHKPIHFGWRGPIQEDGGYPIDLMWISSTRRMGKFAALKADTDSKPISVDCIWISGSQSGKKFTLNRTKPILQRPDVNTDYFPTYVYRQTPFITFVIQLLAILPIIDALKWINQHI